MKEEQKIGFGLVLRAIAKKDDKLLLLQRPSKSSHDNGRWELPGGKIKKGEFFDEGLRREVLEETGLDVSGFDGGYVFSYKRENPGEGDNYFVDIYKFVGNFDERDVKPQEEETDGFMLATVDEIKEFAKQGIFLHYDSIKQVFE